MDAEDDSVLLTYQVIPPFPNVGHNATWNNPTLNSGNIWPYASGEWHDLSALPPGHPFDSYVIWTPGPDECGAHRIIIKVTQADGNMGQCEYTLYKPCPSDPPNCTNFDICGVCNGDGSSCPSSPDPSPTPNPTPPPPCQGEPDVCGVCNGDGSTCADSCQPKDLFPTNTQFDTNAFVLLKFHELMQKIVKRSTGKYFKNFEDIANKAYLEIWNTANNGLPKIQLLCPVTAQCVTFSTGPYVKQLLKNIAVIVKASAKLLARAKKAGLDSESEERLERRLMRMKYIQKSTKINAKKVPGVVNTECTL